jgi:hypothetical protein
MCIPEGPAGIAKRGSGGQGTAVTDSLQKKKRREKKKPENAEIFSQARQGQYLYFCTFVLVKQVMVSRIVCPIT